MSIDRVCGDRSGAGDQPTATEEFVKPSESAFVQAMTRAKWPAHYLAVSSVTGKPRVLFLTGYDSFPA